MNSPSIANVPGFDSEPIRDAASGDPTYRWVLWTFISLLLGLEYFFILATGAWFTYRYWRAPYRTAFVPLIIFLASSLAVSAIMGLVRDGAADRMPSSIYSIGILVGGLLCAKGIICHIYAAHHRRGMDDDFRAYLLDILGHLAQKVVYFSAALFVAGIVYFAVTRSPSLGFPTLLHTFKDSTTELLRYLSETRIYRSDWGFGSFPAPRFIYFARWDTAGAIIVGLAGNLAAARLWQKSNVKAFILVEVLTALLILSTLSRTVIVLHFAFSTLMYLFIVRRKGLLIAMYLVGGALVLGAVYSANLLEAAAGFRQYSTEDRFNLYTAALAEFAHNNPLFGLGYKPKEANDNFDYAIGSHSILLSYLTRGGLLATAMALATFWLLPAIRVVLGILRQDALNRRMWPFWARGLAVIGAWTLFQEIDTSMLTFTCIILFFLAIGIFTRRPIQDSA